MTYLLMDDGFDDHPKVGVLSDKAFRLHVSVMCRCCRYLTDGLVTRGLLASVRYGSNAAVIRELVEARLWEEDPEGYRVHDFLDRNPSAADVLAKREAARERMRGARSKKVRANRPPDTEQCSQDVRANISRTSRDVRLTPSHPIPSPDQSPLPPSGEAGDSDHTEPGKLGRDWEPTSEDWITAFQAGPPSKPWQKALVTRFKRYHLDGDSRTPEDWRRSFRMWAAREMQAKRDEVRAEVEAAKSASGLESATEDPLEVSDRLRRQREAERSKREIATPEQARAILAGAAPGAVMGAAQ